MPADKLTAIETAILRWVVRRTDAGDAVRGGYGERLNLMRSLERRGFLALVPGPKDRWRATDAGREEVRDAR